MALRDWKPVARQLATGLMMLSLVWSGWALAQSPGVVYHVDDGSKGRFVLHLAEDHLAIDPEIRIAVVTYAGGVDFLLTGAEDRKGRPYEPTVRALMDKGVQFRVCSATLDFRDIPEDRVLDGVALVPSGTYEIIRWQRDEGFVYLKP